MIWHARGFLRWVVICGLSIPLVVLMKDATARGPGGGGRPSAHVSRAGPAQSGSFNHAQGRDGERGDARPAPERSDRPTRREPTPDRIDTRREHAAERDRDRDRDDRYEDRPEAPAPDRVAKERREDRREDRRDYYDDRRDFARGARHSAVWWTRSCSQAAVVIVDDYSYYHCDDVWFSRTYYGGEVIYTVVDAPPGY